MATPIASPTPVQIGVVIRFKNSAATLARVLGALRAQTVQPGLILGVDTGSTDGSAELLRAAGARVVPWEAPYHHSKVLNFGFRECVAERVLVLSSHTVLESPDALEKMNAALDDPRTACASGKWDDDTYYSDAIDWEELKAKGLKLGSIYSNSFGLVRRSLWEELPFDENVPTMEDYLWAVTQVRRGHVCRRVKFAYSYQRAPDSRDFLFTAGVFYIASRFGLRVAWMGRKATLREMLRLWRAVKPAKRQRQWHMHRERLRASLAWRWSFA